VRRLRYHDSISADHPGVLGASRSIRTGRPSLGDRVPSKTPTLLLDKSHGFNSVHGRMPSVLTGANLANRDLIYLGVLGDGDSA
jgi:pyruvate/2-oxoacid:ferredoxin oxidoreductase beta subunit